MLPIPVWCTCPILKQVTIVPQRRRRMGLNATFLTLPVQSAHWWSTLVQRPDHLLLGNCQPSAMADFLLVYIDEAHPSDGWAVPGDSSMSFEVKKHRNQEDRCAAAHQLLERFSLPPQCQVVADRMDNNANVAYGVAFERVCIVQRRKIAYLGGKGPFSYNLQEVRSWLEKNFSKR
ncbi:rCG20972 [Rattus norvegicus]|uniref:Iodothyronine deiodinase n=1 Tax=Rattus norvegicus TaxID=10116 RepID=A6JEC2_RAT|nr:rCG20972 [Rattus norvegicus]